MKTVVALLMMLGAVPLAAQGDRWQRQIDSALTRAIGLATRRGFVQAGSQLTGALFLEESEHRTIPLAAGGNYLMVAVCDADCRTLNLVLSNPHGDEIAYDRQEGNVPLVETTGARGGDYRLKVIMRECLVSPCRYGVMVFRKSVKGEG